MLFNPLNAISVESLKETEAAANARGITLIAASARSPEELASALQLVLNENAAALIGGGRYHDLLSHPEHTCLRL